MPSPAKPTTVDLTRGIYRRVFGCWLKGRRINAVSIEAEALFLRLILCADDFGNVPGDPEDILIAAYPRRRDITVEQVAGWLEELAGTPRGALIARYEAGGEFYLHLCDWSVFQKAGPNGRRMQRHPMHPPGESKAQDSPPGESKAQDSPSGEARAPETETDAETEGQSQHQDETEPEADAPGSDSAKRAQFPSASTRQESGPMVLTDAHARWCHAWRTEVGQLYSKEPQQHAADRTDAMGLFIRLYPAGMDEGTGKERIRLARALIPVAKRNAKGPPMAYLKTAVSNLLETLDGGQTATA